MNNLDARVRGHDVAFFEADESHQPSSRGTLKKDQPMDFELPEELAEVQELARDFAEKEIA